MDKLTSLSVLQYLDLLKARKSAPGGGSALGLCLSIAASLLLMSLNFTLGKENYPQELIKETIQKVEKIKKEGDQIIDSDAENYLKLMEAFKSKDQIKIRNAAYLSALGPLTLYFKAEELRAIAKNVRPYTNKNLLSDLDIGYQLTEVIMTGSKENVMLNLPYLDQQLQEEIKKKLND